VSLERALDRWRLELARLQAIDAWLSAGKPEIVALFRVR
jgi:hypothetical protein